MSTDRFRRSGTWLLFVRARRVDPLRTAVACALIVIMTAGTGLLASFTSSAIAASAQSQPVARAVVSVLIVMIVLAVSGASLRWLSWRVERSVLDDQAAEVASLLESADRVVAGSRTRQELGVVATRVVGWSHRGSLRVSTDLLAIRCRGLAGVALVCVLSPAAAVALAATCALYGRHFTSFLDDVLSGLDGEGSLEAQRSRYVRTLHFNHSLAAELRVFGALPWLCDSFATLSRLGRQSASIQRRARARSVVVAALACVASLLGFIVWIVWRTWNGDMEVGSLALGVQGALMVLDLGPVGDTAIVFRRAVQVERELDAIAAGQSLASAQPPNGIAGIAIECHDIKHTYSNSTLVSLDVPHLHIAAGERVAIVGPNGAGKSTLLGVLGGWIRPTDGAVARNGTVSMSLQRAVRYPTDLASNITLGHSSEGWSRVFQDVGLDEADLSGYESEQLLGAPNLIGADLSGGQWQRVGLARAFAQASATILLLDEPSAALDPRSERKFFQAVVDGAHGRTVVLTTHHLANVRFVDRIIVMNDGRIVEEGTHDELFAARGVYADMFTKQAGAYGVET